MGRRHAHPGKRQWVAVKRVPLMVGSMLLILARGRVWSGETARPKRFSTKAAAEAATRSHGGTAAMKATDAEETMRSEAEERRRLIGEIFERARLA